jgi:hypothetical protein
MRTSFYAFVTLSGLIILAGCDIGDEGPSVIGTYTLSQENTTGCVDQGNNVKESRICTPSECETLTISGDGTFSVVETDNGITSSIGGNYIINANEIIFSTSSGGVSDVDNATFALHGAQLIITYEQDPDECIKSETFIRK